MITEDDFDGDSINGENCDYDKESDTETIMIKK